MSQKSERIQKVIANYGNFSRREVEKLIGKGEVKINGVIALLGQKVTLNDSIEINGKKVNLNLKRDYYVLNKPKGYICSKIDKREKSTISLIKDYDKKNIFTVGRLDVQTTGLIIITNDGELSNYVLSPKNKVKKTYLVWYKNKLSKDDIFKLKNGVEIDDFITKKLVNLKLVDNEKALFLKMTLIEGKNNQIRKMFKALDNEVINLKRIQIEDIKINDLKIGKYKKYNQQEIYNLLNVSM